MNAHIPGRATSIVLIGTSLVPMLGGASIAPALPAIQEAFHATPHAALLSGLVLTTHALAILLLSPLAGWLGDRGGRRRTLLLGLALFGIAGTSGAYLPDLPTILAGRFVLGAGVALIMTSVTGLIADLFDIGQRQRLLGAQAAAATGGGVLFMLAAGALATVHWRATFLIYLLGVIMLVPVFLWVPAVRASSRRPADEQPAPAGGALWSLAAPVVAVFLLNLLFYVIPLQVPSLMVREYGAGPFAVAVAMSAMSVTMAPAALLYSRAAARVTSPLLVAASFATPVLGFALMAASRSLLELIGGMMVLAAGVGLASPALNNWVVTLAPERLRGRALGILVTGVFLGQFLSPLATQPIIDEYGLRHVFASLAATSLLAAGVFGVIGWRERGGSISAREAPPEGKAMAGRRP